MGSRIFHFPILLRIPYGYGLLFNRKLVHAGGIGPSESPETVFSEPDSGVPHGHMYVVKDNSQFPYNFVCYEERDKYVSAYPSAYTTAVKILQNVKFKEQKRRKTKGEYVAPPTKQK